MKQAIILQTLLNLTEYLEKEISNLSTYIIRNNASLKDKKSDTISKKVVDNFAKRQDCLVQLQLFKIAKTEANMIADDDGVTNNHRIFKLSDLNRNKKFLETLINQKLKSRSKGEVDQYTFMIPKSTLEKELLETEHQISEIKQKLSEFNESQEIEVEINPDLNLI